MEYKPSPWGTEFHSLRVDDALGGGSAGPGKTTALLYDPAEQVVVEHKRCSRAFDHRDELMVRLAKAAGARRGWENPTLSELAQVWERDCYHEPGSSTGEALHMRRLARSLDQSMSKFKAMFRSIDPTMEWNESKQKARFYSGYTYSFGHCKDPDDYMPYYSNEYTYLGFDELVQFLENQWDQIGSRLRSSDWVLRTMLKRRGMSNPVIVRDKGDDFLVNDPYWVRRVFVDPAPGGGKILVRKIRLASGKIKRRTRLYLPARLSDNPNKEFQEIYEFNLRTMKPHLRRALLDADWYVTAGSFYSENWIPHLHVCEPFAIPYDWPCIRSMDWGYKKPGCIHWAALDPEGTLWVFREIYFQGKHPDEVARLVKEIETEEGLWDERADRSKLIGYADNQLWEERGDRGPTKAEEFARCGVNWLQADKRSRRRNAQRFAERLDDHDDGSQTPGIVFFNTCRHAITTIPAIPTKNEGPGAGEEPLDGGDDHAHDSILYLVAGASRPVSWSTDDGIPKPVHEDENRGSDGYGCTY